MKKNELLFLLNRIKMNNLCIDISKLLQIDSEVVEASNNINDDIIFTNAYLIANTNIENKLFIIESMSKIKEPLISEVIYKQVEINNDSYIISKLSMCESLELAKAYRLLLNNKDFIRMSNYKEIIELLNDEKIPEKIMFINSILSNRFMINNSNKVENIVKLVKRCQSAEIAFYVYKVIIDEYLIKCPFYEELIEKLIVSKNKEMATSLYMVISDKKMQERNDYIDIIRELFDVLNKDEYYELTNIENLIIKFMENKNLSELKEKLICVPNNQEIEEKMLILVLK